MYKNVSILAIEHPFEGAVFRACALALIVLSFAYVYFVGSSILNVIARKEAATEAAKLSAAIGNAEKEYFAMSEAITPQTGGPLGLSAVSRISYVYRPGAVGAAPADSNDL